MFLRSTDAPAQWKDTPVHESAFSCSLQSIQQLTAPNWTPAACLSCAFFLDQSPRAGKQPYCIQECKHTNVRAYTGMQRYWPTTIHLSMNTHTQTHI